LEKISPLSKKIPFASESKKGRERKRGHVQKPLLSQHVNDGVSGREKEKEVLKNFVNCKETKKKDVEEDEKSGKKSRGGKVAK